MDVDFAQPSPPDLHLHALFTVVAESSVGQLSAQGASGDLFAGAQCTVFEFCDIVRGVVPCARSVLYASLSGRFSGDDVVLYFGLLIRAKTDFSLCGGTVARLGDVLGIVCYSSHYILLFLHCEY